MDCFTYVNGVIVLKLPSGKLIKSNLNQPKPLFMEVLHVPEGPPEDLLEAPLDTKPIDLPCVMDNIAHPDNDTLLTRRP